jgi:hypothetical protein
MAEGLAALVDGDDGLVAELAGAAVLVMVAGGDRESLDLFVSRIIPELESGGNPRALALLLAIASSSDGVLEEVARTASAAAGRLVARGVPRPRWADEVAEPVRVGDCVRLADSRGAMSILAASFERAGSGHAFVVFVDPDECGEATDILLADAAGLPQALDDVRKKAQSDGFDLRTQPLTPAEFRWYVEDALDSRAVHDMDGDPDPDMADDEAPPYPVLAWVVRSRLAGLPPPSRPAGAQAATHDEDRQVAMLEILARTLGGSRRAPVAGPGGLSGVSFARSASTKLPAKRKKSAGPAPVYQVKVSLLGAKPPIWRRLLVPADVTLARLHAVIQAAFGWLDSHLHVFETPYGDFGQPDPELGHRSEAPVTLEQVAPQAKDKIRYTYDFGDGWEHEIMVEQVLQPDPALTYPRCTGGRRAAPPDDCGGIWGYQELVEILTDPSHPEHGERRSWFGLDEADQFDPAEFDIDEVNAALATLRRSPRKRP